ncbi:MAG: hypothetical protein HFK08_02475 [Clostridia bacterium]|jgi:hypothetical protein|nr:hypothetical protein [Clostridia bacterium]
MNVKELIKNKGLGYWLSCGAALLALVTAIIVFATSGTALPNTASNGWVIGLVLLIGVAVQVVVTFLPLRFASVISVLCYTLAFGVVANKIPTAVADYFNKVAYTGGSFEMCMFYAVAVFAVALIALVSCFFAQTKDGKTII